MSLAGRSHVPARTCLVCGGKKNKFSLLRMALDSDKWIVLDHRHCLEGRGAYLCADCLPRLRWNGRVKKAFRNEARGLAQDTLLQLSSR